MKKQLLFFKYLVFATSLAGITACYTDHPYQREEHAQPNETKQQNQNNQKVDANRVTDAMQAEREELSAKMKRQVEELDAAIKKLDRKIENAAAEEKVGLQEHRDRFAQERDELNIDLRRVGENMADNWDAFKNDVVLRIKKIEEDLNAVK